MRGSYNVIVATKRIEYNITINRNITIIKGDSATGKTTLISLVQRYYEQGNKSGVRLTCEKTCMVIGGKDWQKLLVDVHNTIVFIDEGNAFVKSHDFANTIKNSDNYYVIITRESLKSLPYSVNEIYGLQSIGHKKISEKTYNSMYKLYGILNNSSKITPNLIITEDSNAGFDFFNDTLNIPCISGEGRDKIINKIINRPDKNVLIIADGAAFGCAMESLLSVMIAYTNYTLYLPESFEWLVLKSGIIRDDRLSNIMDNPQDYIESKEHYSWERFFTSLLEDLTSNISYVQKYNKNNKIPKQFKEINNAIKILKTIPNNIILSIKNN